MAGETTLVPASAARNFYDNPGAGVFAVVFNLTYLITDNELNDVMQAGYLAGNTRVLGYIWAPSDMDSATAAIHKITVGSVDIATGLTNAQTGVSNIAPALTLPITPANTPTLVSVTTTTAAGTAVAGTAVLILLCQKA